MSQHLFSFSELSPRSLWILGILWTILIVSFWGGFAYQSYTTEYRLAKAVAFDNVNKDLLYRRWAAMHGGVYVPATATTPANPYLQHIPERDITSPSGRALTLVNPAYMTRQVFELGQTQFGLKAHITSLQPLRPQNAADSWEANTLRLFSQEKSEHIAMDTINGVPYLRYMRALITEQNCLKCHAHQGYKLGDIRGGISVSVPWEPFLKSFRTQMLMLGVFCCVLWGCGVLGLVIWHRRLCVLRQERHQAELELQKSNELLTTAQTNAHFGCWELDLIKNRLYWTDEIYRIFGVRPQEFAATYEAFLTAVHPDDRDLVNQAYSSSLREGRDTYEVRHRILRPDGEIRYVYEQCRHVRDSSGKITASIGSVYDLTDLTLAEKAIEQHQQQSLHAQHMEALGLMAGGVAHDFNNLLAVILGQSDALLSRPDLPADTLSRVASIRKAAESSAAVIRDLLAFARRRSPDRLPIDLKAVVKESSHLIFRSLGARIQGSLDLPLEPVCILGSEGQLSHALVNLCFNARDAMPNGGTLKISLGIQTISETTCILTKQTFCGRYAVLSVSDTGSGIDPNIQQKIFLPFFTTKQVGSGNGLGLAGVQGCVIGHQGHMTLQSQVGHGSTFSVYLPLDENPAPLQEEQPISDKTPVIGKILVVDDQESLRTMFADVLGGMGWQVTLCGDPRQAVHLWQEIRSDCSIALVDIAMPVMNGEEVFNAIRASDSNALVVLMSGDGSVVDLDKLRREGLADFVDKPVNIARLSTLMMKLIHERNTGNS